MPQSSRVLLFLLAAVIGLPVIVLSSEADEQQTCSRNTAADDVVATIRKSASRTRAKYTQARSEKTDEMKKLRASNPIAALVSALQSE